MNYLILRPTQRFKTLFNVMFKDIILHGLGLFAFSLVAMASVFYHYIEKWEWIDAVYFSVITLSTVGYGDLSPHTTIGKIFTIGYVLIGLGLFATVIANLGVRVFSAIKQDIFHQSDDKSS